VTFASFLTREGYWRFDGLQIPSEVRIVFPNDRQLARIVAIVMAAIAEE
jgi:hypothetical protein